MFLDFKRENQCFFSLFTIQISSKVQSRVVHGLIDLKFGGGVRESLILNMNGVDRIWSPRKSPFSRRTVSLFSDFKRENRCFTLHFHEFIKE